MQYFEKIAEMGHEQVVFCHDKASGYRGIIAIHDTTLGPALGGCRFWHYATEDAAIVDALRLSRGMTYKNAVAGLNLGGGKSVIIGDNKTTNREMLFRAHGRFVDSLGGRYVTAEDVGTTVEDMDFVHMETKHVTGIGSKSGDPSSVTAHGVFRAIQASAFQKWGSDSLEGRTIAIQGLGHVGYYLAKELHAAGAKLIVTDIDAGRIKRVVDEMGATAVALATRAAARTTGAGTTETATWTTWATSARTTAWTTSARSTWTHWAASANWTAAECTCRKTAGTCAGTTTWTTSTRATWAWAHWRTTSYRAAWS